MFLFVASSLHFPETINNRVFEGEVVCFVSFNIANFFQLSFFVCLFGFVSGFHVSCSDVPYKNLIWKLSAQGKDLATLDFPVR